MRYHSTRNRITPRDVLAAAPVVALGALLLVLPPAPDVPREPTQSSDVAAAVAP